MALPNNQSQSLQNQGEWLLNPGQAVEIAITVAAGSFPPDETSGIIPAGCPMGLEANTKKYNSYNDDGTDSDSSGTGRRTLKGFLKESVDASVYDQPATLVIGNIKVNKSALPVPGDFDAAGITDLAARLVSDNIYYCP